LHYCRSRALEITTVVEVADQDIASAELPPGARDTEDSVWVNVAVAWNCGRDCRDRLLSSVCRLLGAGNRSGEKKAKQRTDDAQFRWRSPVLVKIHHILLNKRWCDVDQGRLSCFSRVPTPDLIWGA
jgi:hypothetical protein